MPSVDARRIIPRYPIPWFGVFHASRGREGGHWSFRCAISPRFSAYPGPIQFGLSGLLFFCLFFFPSNRDAGNRAPDLVGRGRQGQQPVRQLGFSLL